MTTLLDLSSRRDLDYLVQPLSRVAQVIRGLGLPWLVVGATARDLAVCLPYDIAARATADVDVAVAFTDWEAYHALVACFPKPNRAIQHRVLAEGVPVDLVPFGHLERPDRTIAWPPDANPVMSVLGFAEACATAIPVRITADLTVPVASAPCQAVLKLVAWSERGYDKPRRDAGDLRILLMAYGDQMNAERLYTTDLDVLEAYDFDLMLAGAALLGRDAARSIDEAGRTLLATILDPDRDAVERLCRDMGGYQRLSADTLAAFRSGLLSA